MSRRRKPFSAEEIARAEAMGRAGVAWRKIARALGRSDDDALRRELIARGVRPRRPKSPPWTAAEAATLASMRNAGAGFAAIAAALGRSADACAQRWRERGAEARAAPVERACLRCRRAFASEGIHNRLCPHCRCGESSPFEPLCYSGAGIIGRAW